MQKCCLLFGAYAEAVQFASLVQEFQQRNVSFFTVHTAPLQSPTMANGPMQEVAIPTPTYALQHTSWLFNIRDCVQQFAAILRLERATVVLVQEETTSTLVASLATKEVGLPVLYLKAGLRSDKATARGAQNSRQLPAGSVPLGILATANCQPVL